MILIRNLILYQRISGGKIHRTGFHLNLLFHFVHNYVVISGKL